MATMLEHTEAERPERMRHHAEFLTRRGYLRPDVTLSEATDVLWACSSTEFYELLVLQRKWPLPRFALFITEFMTTSLLPTRNTTPPASVRP